MNPAASELRSFEHKEKKVHHSWYRNDCTTRGNRIRLSPLTSMDPMVTVDRTSAYINADLRGTTDHI